MSAELQKWNPVLLTYLRTTTRELKFDWDAVAEDVRLFASREQLLEAVSITPALCRELFASDYTQFEIILTAPELPARPKTEVDIMQEYDSMSYDELMEHVQATEQNMKKRKEQIFSKVLSSLGGVTGVDSATSASMGAALGIEYDQTRQTYCDNLAAKEAERLKKVALAEEQAEKQRLDRERDVLKKRFEAGSADGVGEDPLARSDYKYGDSATHAHDAGDKTTSDLDFIDSLPYDPNVTQALQNYMETDEFDIMLTELEREIDAMAPGKDAGKETKLLVTSPFSYHKVLALCIIDVQ